MAVALTGQDVTVIDGRVFADFANGDVIMLDFPNDLVDMTQGKNGNAVYAFNSTGNIVEATIRVVRGSNDDKYLNSRITEFLIDRPSFVLFTAEFVKRVGDGQGNVAEEVYTMDGGVVVRYPTVKENVEGDIEQSVSVYMIRFTNADRTFT